MKRDEVWLALLAGGSFVAVIVVITVWTMWQLR